MIIRPNLGLANRMRVLNSCIVLNYNKKYNFKIVWEKNKTLNCDFQDLFQPIGCFTIIEESDLLDYFSNYKPDNSPTINGRLKKIKYIIAKAAFNYVDDTNVQKRRFDDNYWLNNINSRYIIDTCHDFFSQSEKNNFYNLFKPVKPLQDKIDYISRNFNTKTIGLHIRRTDNVEAIKRSTTELFLKKTDGILNREPDTLFYLSTDDLETEYLFKKNFGEKIITYTGKNLDRNSTLGIQDATVDLYTLAMTNKIFGSWWSSFSIVSAQIGRIPLEIVS